MFRFSTVFFLALGLAFLTSCADQQKLVANGARHEHPIHLGDEYVWKELQPVNVEGRAVFGIPSNNGQKDSFSKTGLIINLDGPGGFRFPKVVPLLTMIAGTFITASTFREMGGSDYDFQAGETVYNLPYILTIPLALPVWGAVQNAAYSGMSNSGVSGELQRKLIEDNPDVDLFFNPRYDIKYKQGIWSQQSAIDAKLKGATMKPSN